MTATLLAIFTSAALLYAYRNVWLRDPYFIHKLFGLYAFILAVTIILFAGSFGVLFYKASTDPHPPHTDNCAGLAYIIFIPWLILTVISLIVSLFPLLSRTYSHERKQVQAIIATGLIIPVIPLAIICIVGVVKAADGFLH